MPKSALDFMLRREYSMGCMGSQGRGQCPECHGVHESWLGHPLHLDSSRLGHKKGCPLAAAIEELGGGVVYVGTSKLTDRYEIDPTSQYLSTRKTTG